jgi:hypothetical protein
MNSESRIRMDLKGTGHIVILNTHRSFAGETEENFDTVQSG